MELNAATTVPVKLALSGSKRRSRLNVPLKFSQLYQQVRSTFPDIKGFKIEYVDEEGDNIIVASDEDLVEAHNVFKDLGRVLSFIVNTTKHTNAAQQTPPAAAAAASAASTVDPPSMFTNPWRHGNGRCCGRRGRRGFGRRCGAGRWHQMANFFQQTNPTGLAIHFGVTCDGSNQHPLMGTRYHKIGYNYDLNEAEFSKLTPDEQKKYEIISRPGATPVPVSGTAPVRHFGITCDGSNQHPLVGTRYHKIGHNYDLNDAEFSKLSQDEQKKYEIISHPGATPVPVRVPECTFVRDITIPDGQVVSPGKQFKKTWLVKTGAAAWPAGCLLIHVGGAKMGDATPVPLAPQKPNALVEVSIDCVAPSRPGKVTSKWRVAGPNGKAFGHFVWVTIVVGSTAPSAAASAVAAKTSVPKAATKTPVAKTPTVTFVPKAAKPVPETPAKAAKPAPETPAIAAPMSGTKPPAYSVSGAKPPANPVPDAKPPAIPAATVTVETPPVSVSPALQQLRDMGFALPDELLLRVLESAHGDVLGAINALFSGR